MGTCEGEFVKKKPFIIVLLESLWDSLDTAAEGLGSAFVSKKSAYKYLYGRYPSFDKDKYQKGMHYLIRHGYIEKETNSESISFTNKAKLKIVEKLIPDPDKKIRFVSFDIPESLRKERDQFRRTIQRLGFRKLQKSLWWIDKDVTDFVEMAMIENCVSDYVVYIVSEVTDVDKILSGKKTVNTND